MAQIEIEPHKKRFEAYISDKERELIEAMIETGSLTEACKKLHISKQTGSMRNRSIRLRYHRARQFIVEYEKLFRELATVQSKFLQ